MKRFLAGAPRPMAPSSLALTRMPLIAARSNRYQAFDAQLDQEALAQARSWYRDFNPSLLPRGTTTYARSSGPGGQHVNKTETKAITAFPVKELLSMLPKALHSGIRASKYYTASNDSLTFHAQSQRSRTANANENQTKLMEEVSRVYREQVPSETSAEKTKKHDEIEKRFHDSRMRQKKHASSKKQSRRGPAD